MPEVRSPLLENMQAGRTSLGAWTSDADMIRLMAHVGFDWVMIDMMFTANDWAKVDHLVTTCEASGITPVVRIQSYPWLGYDQRIAVDVSRAQGIGAQFVLVSNSCKKEIDDCMAVAKDWHRRALVVHPFDNIKQWKPKIERMNKETIIIPQAESKGAFDKMDETLAIPGLRGFFFAMTDASRVLGSSNEPDWYSQKLWTRIEETVKIGKKRDIMIGANTSYAYDLEELSRRTVKLQRAGVRMIMIQGAPFLFQLAIGQFLHSVRKSLNK